MMWLVKITLLDGVFPFNLKIEMLKHLIRDSYFARPC